MYWRPSLHLARFLNWHPRLAAVGRSFRLTALTCRNTAVLRFDTCPTVQRQEALQSPMEQLLHTLPDLKSSPAGSVASMAAEAAQLLPCTDMSSEG